MALVKKKIIETITVTDNRTFTDSPSISGGPKVIFPYQQLVKLKRVTGTQLESNPVASGVGQQVGLSFNFFLLDVNGNDLQTISSKNVQPWVNRTGWFGCNFQNPNVIFFDDTLCGGVQIDTFCLQGSPSIEGTEVEIYFTFEIEKEVWSEEF